MANIYTTFGTLDSLDAIVDRNFTVVPYGEDLMYQHITQYLETWNMFTSEFERLMGIETTKDLQRRDGAGAVVIIPTEVNEIARPLIQKGKQTPDVLGFPIGRYRSGQQWSYDFLRRVSFGQLINQTRGIVQGAQVRYYREFRRALFVPLPTHRSFDNQNYAWTEGEKITLLVRSLACGATGSIYPSNPDGSVVPDTHNHYCVPQTANSPTSAEVQGLINHVTEHNQEGEVALYINLGSETAIRAMTGFTPFTDVRVVQPITSAHIDYAYLDLRKTWDRAIGIFGAATVFVKPWVPVGYMIATVSGQRAILAKREGRDGGELRLVSTTSEHPLYSDGFEQEYGFGVQNRLGAAIMDVAHGKANGETADTNGLYHTNYAAPNVDASP